MPRGVKGTPTTHPCEWCGALIVATTKRERGRRFCSVACSSRWLGKTYGRTAPRRTRNVSETHRQCRTCAQIKPFAEFYSFIAKDRPSRPLKRQYFSDCKQCSGELRRRDRYGVTLAEMIERQGSDVCPLCLTRKADSLDHDHATGRPRGAICRKCNLILHYIDDLDWRKRAEAYVAREI